MTAGIRQSAGWRRAEAQKRKRLRVWRVRMRSGNTRIDSGATRVRNRDILLLSEVVGIMQAVRRIEELRGWQRDRMVNITQHFSGMPGGSGGVPKGFDEAFARLAELDEQHEQKCMEYVKQLKAAQRILNSIPSPTMRVFVTLKYVMNMPDREIREQLNMTRWGYDQARRCVEEAEDMASVVWRERYILSK